MCVQWRQHCQYTSSTTIGEGDNCEDARPMCLEICAQSRRPCQLQIEGSIRRHRNIHYIQPLLLSGEDHCVWMWFTSAISKSGKSHWGLQMEAEDSFATKRTRVLLLPPALSKLTQQAFLLLRRDAAPAIGAAKAYHESQLSNLQDRSAIVRGCRRRHGQSRLSC